MLRFRLRASLACALACPLVGVFFEAHDALACGACFHSPPPTQVIDTSLVTDHRMAFSISLTQTVLWDQIRYSGSPGSFAWVLPVRTGAKVELSTDAWLAALDASTRTVITGPTPVCGGGAPTQYEGSGGGCGGMSAESATSGEIRDLPDAGTPTVQVISESIVGPYEAVTVRSSQGEALGAWLTANGYEIPPTVQPTIDAYTTAGFDFIALKLAPGQGVQAMQPVRVVTPGADLTLPLRMVAAGVGAHVGLELYVLAEGRYHTQNFPDATVDFTQLAWDPHNDISNYSTLVDSALAANQGTAWLTESAAPADLRALSLGGVNPGLAFAYSTNCLPIVPTCNASFDAGSGDAGASVMAMCTLAAVCDDLSVATKGIAGSLWVTRLRADLPASALATDLTLEATTQTQVPSLHTTEKYTDPNYNPCPGSSGSTSSASSGSGQGSSCAVQTKTTRRARYADAIELSFGTALMALAWRRRRRR
jgi:hypothetical protein